MGHSQVHVGLAEARLSTRGTVARESPRCRHLLISGTGRTGTSFLVRFLDALGLETQFSGGRGKVGWDEAANAGAEDLPLSTLDPNLPYVVKTPWASEFVDQLLLDPGISLDAVVLPMRDLGEAAASRTVVELRDMVEKQAYLSAMRAPWMHRGSAPGGTVFSLHPLDQERILAVSFHRLLERLVAADVPIVLLSFPRLAEDAAYLHAKLAPVLPRPISLREARAAHARVADPKKIRVNRETADPTIASLDRIALNREIERLRAEVASLQSAVRDSGTLGRIGRVARRAVRPGGFWRLLRLRRLAPGE
jgi:hypothetical protein